MQAAHPFVQEDPMRILLFTLLAVLLCTSIATAKTTKTGHTQKTAVAASTAMNHINGERWKAWDTSPNRVEVTVDNNGKPSTYYFDDLGIAHGYLIDKFGPAYKLVSVKVVNPGNVKTTVDATQMFYVVED